MEKSPSKGMVVFSILLFIAIAIRMIPYHWTPFFFKGARNSLSRDIILPCVVLSLGLGVACSLVQRMHWLMRWSWRQFLPERWRMGDENILLLPLRLKYIGIPYVLLLLYVAPALAFWEEYMFRSGSKADHPLLWSLAFGFSHAIVGVTVGTCLVLAFLGYLFSWLYFRGNLTLSGYIHAIFNWVGLSLALLARLYMAYRHHRPKQTAKKDDDVVVDIRDSVLTAERENQSVVLAAIRRRREVRTQNSA